MTQVERQARCVCRFGPILRGDLWFVIQCTKQRLGMYTGISESRASIDRWEVQTRRWLVQMSAFVGRRRNEGERSVQSAAHLQQFETADS